MHAALMTILQGQIPTLPFKGKIKQPETGDLETDSSNMPWSQFAK